MCSVSVCKCARVLVLVLSLKLKEQDGDSSRCSCSLCVDVFSVASDWLDSNEITAKTCTLMCVCVCTSVSLPVWEVWVSHRCSETLLDTSTLLSLFTAHKTWLMNYRFISWGRHEEHKTKVHKTSVEKTKKWKFYVQTKLSVPDFEKQKHQMLNVELQISNTSLLASVC